MNNTGAWLLRALAALAIVTAAACKSLKLCGPPGQTQACVCSDARNGAQQCLPERVWGKCDCTGAIVLDAAAPGAGQTDAGNASATGGNGGADGMSLQDAGKDASTPGAIADEDGGGGAAPAPDAGQGGAGGGGAAGGSGSGGAGGGGSGGSGGGGGGGEYKSCSASTECGGGQCTTTQDPANLLGTIGVCAPPCTDAATCPLPAGSYEATASCDNGYCHLNCTGSGFPFGTDRTCPSAMSCVALLGVSYCYAN